MQKPRISIVIPLYNEENVFRILIERIDQLKKKLSYQIEIVLVDDGSQDQTSLLMEKQAQEDEDYHCIFLSRNYGQQVAVSAGMQLATASEAIMLMDGDLQDPPELLEKFYLKIKEGYEVVQAIRKKRRDSLFIKLNTWIYYRLQNMITSYMSIDSGDCSMMSRRVVDHINAMPERNRFIRGLRSWVGFKQTSIFYERDRRFAGNSKYSLFRLLKLASNGIFNFSDLPLKFITYMGMITVILSTLYTGFIFSMKILYGNVPKGFTTLIVALTLFSGVQLISIGVLGEYISRIFVQVKERPLFLIRKRVQKKKTIDG